MSSRATQQLDQLATLDPDGAAWLAKQLDACVDPLALRLAFARAARKLSEPHTIALARRALVLALLERVDEPARVEQLHRGGEIGEQASVLEMLASLPAPERFTALAIDACRTNVRSVFCAIALDNPFPAAHFPEPAFNQMVLKTLFLGLSARSILGLPERVGPELQRMVAGYADERRAAGRRVPDDVDWILALRPGEPS